MDKYTQKLSTPTKGISKEAVLHLQAYDWPGNVRELENAIHSALIVCQGESILPQHLPLRIQGYPQADEIEEQEDLGLEERLKNITDNMERKMILNALEESGGSRTRAAEILKISRKTLFNKMRKLGITQYKIS